MIFYLYLEVFGLYFWKSGQYYMIFCGWEGVSKDRKKTTQQGGGIWEKLHRDRAD